MSGKKQSIGQKCRAYKQNVLRNLRETLKQCDRIYGSELNRQYSLRYGRASLGFLQGNASSKSCSDVLKHFKYITAGLLDWLNMLYNDDDFVGSLQTSLENGVAEYVTSEVGQIVDIHPLARAFNRRRKRHSSSGSRYVWSKKRILTVASALVSGKKRLVDPCIHLTRNIENTTCGILSVEERTLPEGYLAHVRQICGRIFSKKKNRHLDYYKYVESQVLSKGACLGSRRSEGGSAGLSLWSREEFLELHQHEVSFTRFTELAQRIDRDSTGAWINDDLAEKPMTKYNLVVGGGKARGITMNTGNHQLLKPLHKMFYDVISGERWLFRGEANEDRFSHFTTRDRELFVSGDYTSATDNLTILVAEEIVRSFCGTLKIPEFISAFAMRSLRTDIYRSGKNGKVDHEKGQLMGSLLSFPLLCLQNYIAFRWLVSPEEVSDDLVRINGDDIFFRASSDVIDRWRGGVADLGLELSSGKTFVDENFFSLNSTYFWAGSDGSKMLPVARFGILRVCKVYEFGTLLEDWMKPFSSHEMRKGAVREFYRLNGCLKRSPISLLDKSPYGLWAKILISELHASALDHELSCFGQRSVKVKNVVVRSGFEVPMNYYALVSCGDGPSLRSTKVGFTEIRWQTGEAKIKLRDTMRGLEDIAVLVTVLLVCLLNSDLVPSVRSTSTEKIKFVGLDNNRLNSLLIPRSNKKKKRVRNIGCRNKLGDRGSAIATLAEWERKERARKLFALKRNEKFRFEQPSLEKNLIAVSRELEKKKNLKTLLSDVVYSEDSRRQWSLNTHIENVARGKVPDQPETVEVGSSNGVSMICDHGVPGPICYLCSYIE